MLFASVGDIEENTEILCKNFVEAICNMTLITNTYFEDYKDNFMFFMIRQPSFIFEAHSRFK
jgi:hypothetical protein